MNTNAYWRSVVAVFSGTAVAQSIPILGSLVIARIYVPAEFGSFMSWLGIATVVAVFGTCRFENALALEPDGEPRRRAAMATALTTLIVLMLVVLAGGALYAVRPDILPILPPHLILLLPPIFLVLTFSQIWQAWAAAEGLFKALSFMRILQAVAITGLQIAAGLLDPSAATLAIAHIIGVISGVVMAMVWLPPSRLFGGRESLFAFWSRYRKFPLFSMPGDSVNSLAAQLPLLVVASRFGAEAAGYLALAMRTLGAPIALMGVAVLDVFKRQAGTAWRARGNCRAEYLQTFWVLCAGSALASSIIFIFGEELFVVAFGETWRKAGTAAVILLPMFALRFIASPLSFTFYIAEKQQIDLIWQLCLLSMVVYVLNQMPDYSSTLIGYAIGYSALYVVYLFTSYTLSRGEPHDCHH